MRKNGVKMLKTISKIVADAINQGQRKEALGERLEEIFPEGMSAGEKYAVIEDAWMHEIAFQGQYGSQGTCFIVEMGGDVKDVAMRLVGDKATRKKIEDSRDLDDFTLHLPSGRRMSFTKVSCGAYLWETDAMPTLKGGKNWATVKRCEPSARTGGERSLQSCISEIVANALDLGDGAETLKKRFEEIFPEGMSADEKLDAINDSWIYTISVALGDFARKVISDYGKVDFLINNAKPSMKGISDCSFDEFNYALLVGVTAPFYLAKLFLPHFSEQAAIVNISSSRDRMSQPQTESYAAAKGGINALTHALAVSLSGKVRVNSISPGWIDTDSTEHSGPDACQHPVGRVGNPMDVANMVLFLCSDKAGFITGENICIDGGMTRQMIYHGDFGWKLHG